MTTERKNELYEKMFSWIYEHLERSEDLYLTFHDQIGMTREELNDHSIESLDKFFTPTVLFKDKVKRCYEQYRDKWLTMTPGQLIENAEELYAVAHMTKMAIKGNISADTAEYMLRFVNPLEVMADEWIRCKGSGTLVPEDDVEFVLADTLDTHDAEQDYLLEPEYQESDEDEAPTISM